MTSYFKIVSFNLILFTSSGNILDVWSILRHVIKLVLHVDVFDLTLKLYKNKQNQQTHYRTNKPHQGGFFMIHSNKSTVVVVVVVFLCIILYFLHSPNDACTTDACTLRRRVFKKAEGCRERSPNLSGSGWFECEEADYLYVLRGGLWSPGCLHMVHLTHWSHWQQQPHICVQIKPTSLTTIVIPVCRFKRQRDKQRTASDSLRWDWC